MLVLIKMDNFIVDCHRKVNKNLVEKPLVVLDKKTKKAVSISSQAMMYGVEKGFSLAQIRNIAGDFCKVVIAHRKSLYNQIWKDITNVSHLLGSKIEAVWGDYILLRIHGSSQEFSNLLVYSKDKLLEEFGVNTKLVVAKTRPLLGKVLEKLNLEQKSCELYRNLSDHSIYRSNLTSGSSLEYSPEFLSQDWEMYSSLDHRIGILKSKDDIKESDISFSLFSNKVLVMS